MIEPVLEIKYCHGEICSFREIFLLVKSKFLLKRQGAHLGSVILSVARSLKIVMHLTGLLTQPCYEALNNPRVKLTKVY